MATPLPTISVEQRRARLARRHRLVPGHRAADAVESASSLVALHGTDPGTIFLSAWARVDGFAVADLEAALYEDRSLVKHMAMRRTLWVFPRSVLPLAQAGVSSGVAATERKRLIAEVEKAGLFPDGARWLDDACAQVLAVLSDGTELTSSELRTQLPVLEGSMVYGEGRSWGGTVPVGPRVLTVVMSSWARVTCPWPSRSRPSLEGATGGSIPWSGRRNGIPRSRNRKWRSHSTSRP